MVHKILNEQCPEILKQKFTKRSPVSKYETRRANDLRGGWPSGLYSLRQVTEVKLGRVRSDFGWVTSED